VLAAGVSNILVLGLLGRDCEREREREREAPSDATLLSLARRRLLQSPLSPLSYPGVRRCMCPISRFALGAVGVKRVEEGDE
jgi:hypothetical protein